MCDSLKCLLPSPSAPTKLRIRSVHRRAETMLRQSGALDIVSVLARFEGRPSILPQQGFSPPVGSGDTHVWFYSISSGSALPGQKLVREVTLSSAAGLCSRHM
jgi:hypothetical protein